MAEKTRSRPIVAGASRPGRQRSGYSKWSCTGPLKAVLASIEKNLGKRTIPARVAPIEGPSSRARASLRQTKPSRRQLAGCKTRRGGSYHPAAELPSTVACPTS